MADLKPGSVEYILSMAILVFTLNLIVTSSISQVA